MSTPTTTDAAIEVLAQIVAAIHPKAGHTVEARGNMFDEGCAALSVLRNAETPATAHGGWYCPYCQRGVDGREVTFTEQHESCGTYIGDATPPAPPAGGFVVETLRTAAKRLRLGVEGQKTADDLESIADGMEASPTAQPSAKDGVRGEDILADLDFEPDENHTIADMANVGRSLMKAIAVNMPDYMWNETPAEIVCDLINERDEAKATTAAGLVDGHLLAPHGEPDAEVNAFEQWARKEFSHHLPSVFERLDGTPTNRLGLEWEYNGHMLQAAWASWMERAALEAAIGREVGK